MSFIVSARKYRPSRFTDVVGQEHVTRTLKNALQTDQLAHAFLFCGPRGVGKTTCARILAKVLNCQNPTADYEPCNECSFCRAFSENASFNIMELDAASNNSVEHIRALIDQVRFQPQQGKYKVFIIDEVHMLSQAAFNAFLKTLEEPPPYAIFILATTEKHKILPTILSRCQIFDFKRIQIADMAAHLEGICRQEGIEAEPDALHIIAQKADGALRDALSIFDRMVAFSGKRITYEAVIHNLNVLDYDYYFQIIDALLMEDASRVLLLFDEIVRKGFEPDLFINGLAGHLRNLLVCQDPETLQLLEAGESLRNRYQLQAQLTPASMILTALNMANDCDVNYKMARNKRLHVEMALLKMAYLQRMITTHGEPAAVPAEKKTPDRREVTKKELVSAPKPLPETPAEPEKELPPSNVAPAREQKAGLKTTGKFAMHKVLALEAIAQEVRQNEDSGIEMGSVEDLTLEKVSDAWKSYVEASSQEAVRNLLKEVPLELNGKTLTATVGSNLMENTLRQETGLMEHIRDTFRIQDLILDIRLKRKTAESMPKPKRTLTEKEKLIKLNESNPLVKEICDRFDLRFEE